ncbi:Glycolipid transfer protein 1 [Heracleum sosnowskyi]|uniref:Glycolipid transfer protein 1 n=1 Tax=Heracleum sosnowskyi TaxID=360622 RepID=A0AAD8H7C3_9APIA|nr:Glycolipid transfer protein 1 [Heracleum sosnowskyi]
MEEKAGTVFSASLEKMKHVKSNEGDMLTQPFLDVCKLVLPILDKFGPAMAIVKSDVGGNISRLEHKYESNPTKFNYLFGFVQPEIETDTAKSWSSCTNAILWLTRAMDFLVVLFSNLSQHQDWGMQQCCNDSYSKTLKKWHGWLASSSFTVAIKLVPDRKRFLEVLGGAENIQADMENFCTEFSPILRGIHKFLASCRLDGMKAL